MWISKLGLVRLLSINALGLHSSIPKFSFPDKLRLCFRLADG
jgi:hypothetical protein